MRILLREFIVNVSKLMFRAKQATALRLEKTGHKRKACSQIIVTTVSTRTVLSTAEAKTLRFMRFPAEG